MDRVEWSNAPKYIDVPPGALSFSGGDVWQASATPEQPLEPILGRVIGEYILTLGDETVTTPVNVVIPIDPQSTSFFFPVGGNYPESLRIGGVANQTNYGTATFSAEIDNHFRSVELNAYFIHVPEPSTLGLALLGGSVVCLRFARRSQRHQRFI